MVDLISLKQLADASTDAQTLANAINGNDQLDVTSRLGAKYPTLAKAIKEIMSKAPINSTPFATKSALLADTTLADGAFAFVHNDTDDKNGLYQKISGVWQYQKWNALQQSKDYATAQFNAVNDKLKSMMFSMWIDTLYHFVDNEGNIVAKITTDGSLHLVGLDKPLQLVVSSNTKDISSLNNRVQNFNVADALHVWADSEGNIVAKIGLDGKFYIAGLDTDIITAINNVKSSDLSTKDTTLMLNRQYRDTYQADTQALLNTLGYANTSAKAPVPMHLFKQNFTLSKDWINNIDQFGKANATRLTVATPYRSDDGVVHPHILEFYNGFRGYRYIIAITPYYLTNDAYENPCLYGSNDLIQLDLLTGFEQPLDPRPPQVDGGVSAYNSDNVLVYDPRTGELILIWRQTLPIPNDIRNRYSALWMRKTKDGVNWTTKERIFLDSKNPESNIGGAGSPAILYDVKSGYWYLYVNRLDSSSTALRLFKSKNLNEDSWQYVGVVNTTGITGAWHHEVKIIGDKVCILVLQYAASKNLYFGISDDFINFTYTGALMKDVDVYKSSFTPIFDNNNQISFKILFSTTSAPTADADKWRMYMYQTNFINASVGVI